MACRSYFETAASSWCLACSRHVSSPSRLCSRKACQLRSSPRSSRSADLDQFSAYVPVAADAYRSPPAIEHFGATSLSTSSVDDASSTGSRKSASAGLVVPAYVHRSKRMGRDVRLLGCCCRNCAVPRNVGQCQFRCERLTRQRPWLGEQGLKLYCERSVSACRDDLCGPYGLCDPTTSRDRLRDAGDRAPSRNASHARLRA
jgi:hypothetical protein